MNDTLKKINMQKLNKLLDRKNSNGEILNNHLKDMKEYLSGKTKIKTISGKNGANLNKLLHMVDYFTYINNLNIDCEIELRKVIIRYFENEVSVGDIQFVLGQRVNNEVMKNFSDEEVSILNTIANLKLEKETKSLS